jgi:hypothetical protein
MVRTWSRAAGLLTVALLVAVPAHAQVVQGLHVGAGGFFPRGFDARVSDDVLVRNLVGELMPGDPTVSDALLFEIGDFRSGRVFGEWTIGFGPHVEFSAGIGFHQETVPTVYLDVEDENGFEIPLELQLRIVPVTGLVRFLPFGRPGSFQPYVGAGVSALSYRYAEIGEFVDPVTLEIFADRFVKTGTTVGALLLGGVRVPIKGDIYAVTVEYRYQFGSGDTGGADNGFVADKIDLGGGELNFGFLVRF